MKLNETSSTNLSGLIKYWVAVQSVPWLKDALRVDYNTIRNWERKSVRSISDNNFDRIVKFLGSTQETLEWWLNFDHGVEWSSWASLEDTPEFIPEYIHITIKLVYPRDRQSTYSISETLKFSPEIDKAIEVILNSNEIDAVILLLMASKSGCVFKEKLMTVSQILKIHQSLDGNFVNLEENSCIDIDRLIELSEGKGEAISAEEIRLLSGCVLKTANSYWDYNELLAVTGFQHLKHIKSKN